MKIHRKLLTVEQSDLDALNHVNNIRYLEWVQEISGEHWELLAEPEWKTRYVWVVRSHAIEYLKSAVAGDPLALETFVQGSHGPLSERVVTVRHSQSGKTLARCRTQWCLIDRESESLVRIPEAIRLCFEGGNGNPI